MDTARILLTTLPLLFLLVPAEVLQVKHGRCLRPGIVLTPRVGALAAQLSQLFQCEASATESEFP